MKFIRTSKPTSSWPMPWYFTQRLRTKLPPNLQLALDASEHLALCCARRSLAKACSRNRGLRARDSQELCNFNSGSLPLLVSASILSRGRVIPSRSSRERRVCQISRSFAIRSIQSSRSRWPLATFSHCSTEIGKDKSLLRFKVGLRVPTSVVQYRTNFRIHPKYAADSMRRALRRSKPFGCANLTPWTLK